MQDFLIVQTGTYNGFLTANMSISIVYPFNVYLVYQFSSLIGANYRGILIALKTIFLNGIFNFKSKIG